MLHYRSLIACLAFFAASGLLGGASLLAADVAKSDLLAPTSLQNGTALLPAAHSNTPGALLKTFNQPVAETSLGKHTTLAFQGAATGSAAGETSKIGPLIGTGALPVPEPTALFLAGFAGCVLLALAQRLRGTGASLH